jgi:cell migration-inducing and hyaluronan-binding protein
MYGERYDPYIPKFGNKCIGVHNSTLDMHGVERDVTWTSLATTAEVGDSSITLMVDVDWKAEEYIVIASTDLGIEDNEIAGEGDNSEVRKIVSTSGRTMYLDAPLKYEHYANVDEYGTDDDGNTNTIEMRAEVGLLTRNILF